MENDVKNTDKNEKRVNGEEPVAEDVGTEDTGGAGVDAAEPEGVESDARAEGEESEASELEAIRAERDSYLDQLQRTAAEYANYRRRTEQERAQLAAMVRKDVIAQFLPVIDDFERALALIPDDERSKSWATGLQLIDSKFRGILDRADAKIIDPVGEPFDPSKHEAVATEPGTSGQTVVEVYQKGYAIGDLLIRPAMVKTGDAQKVDA